MIHDVKNMDMNTLEKFAEKKDFEKNGLYTNSYKAEDALYNIIYKQAQYSNSYKEYVASVLDRQENGISIFVKGKYSKRLQKKKKPEQWRESRGEEGKYKKKEKLKKKKE